MLYINGEWVQTTNKLDVVNPATGEKIETISTGGKLETKEAIASAKKAFSQWRKTTGEERSSYLKKVVQFMEEKAMDMAKTITKENGKPLEDAKSEVVGAIAYLDWYAEEAKRIYGETLPSSVQDKHLIVMKQPVGVCAAITPWNFPLSMITRKIAPALAAGCTLVLKPAPETPLSAIQVFECFHQAEIPKGVVNLVIGPAEEIGSEMTSSPDVKKLTFTGSTAVGRKLLRDTADTIKKVSLELGGHAPFIVFEDADLDEAVEGVILTKFKNAGQTCISTNRIYVAEKMADQFTKKLTERTLQLKIGQGFDKEVDVGPVINKEALQKIKSQVEDAKEKNGEILCGGKVFTSSQMKGYFYEPTIIRHANEKMKIATEETFGPVVPIFTFKDEKEVIDRANHHCYGLAAYCFTKDLGRGLRMMDQLEFGIVAINDPNPIVIQAPFGGMKQSGLEREGGKYGLEPYLEEKYVSFRTT